MSHIILQVSGDDMILSSGTLVHINETVSICLMPSAIFSLTLFTYGGSCLTNKPPKKKLKKNSVVIQPEGPSPPISDYIRRRMTSVRLSRPMSV